VLLIRFLLSELGLAMRATGANPRMAEAQGIPIGGITCLGMALSNALVALAGALFAQTNGFADVTLGTGTIVVGLAAVIVGESILPRATVAAAVIGCVLGSLVYRIVVALALEADVLGLQASDLNLITAVLVGGALILPATRAKLMARLAPAR
jgi:putative ABC transport system permease protein